MKKLRTKNLNTLEYWEEFFTIKRKPSRFNKMAFHDRGEVIINTIIGELSKEDSILDVGAGLGAIIRQCLAKKKDLKFTAADFSPNGIKYIKEELKIPAYVADITKELPFADNSFDVVICAETLEHLEDPLSALEKLKRIARKKVIVTVPYDENIIDRIISTSHLWSFSEKDFKGRVVKQNPFMVCILKI